MNTEFLIAVIGAISTLIATVLSNWEKLKQPKSDSHRNSGKLFVLLAFVFGLLFMGLTWYVHDNKTRQVKMKGIFKDRIPNQKEVYIAQEDIELDIDNKGIVNGRSFANIKQPDGTYAKKSWLLRGFINGQIIVLSYLNDDNIPDGMGTYVLKLDDDFYLGHETIKDKEGIYITPYVATQKESLWTPNLVNDWLVNYSGHFKRDILRLNF